MAVFGKKSKERLATCHPALQEVMNAAIEEYDFTVLYGHRTAEEQYALYKQGRELRGNKWVKVGKTVTDKDGYTKKSKHNSKPSTAIDIAPMPIDWNNIEAFEELAHVVLKYADELGIKLVWGGDWTMKDYPHFELA